MQKQIGDATYHIKSDIKKIHKTIKQYCFPLVCFQKYSDFSKKNMLTCIGFVLVILMN